MTMQVPKPRHLSSGTWFIQLRLNGVSIPVTGMTEKEVTRKAQLIKAEYLAGKRTVRPSVSDPTLRQAIDRYIAAREKKLSPSTIRGYRTIQRTRFQAYMDRPISKIKDWQAVYNSDHASPKTLYNAISFLRSVVKYVTGSPAPEIYTAPVISTTDENFLDYSQILVLLDDIKGRPCELFTLFALHSMRCSEIMGLTWEQSINLHKAEIIVKGAAVLDEHGERVFNKRNKTTAGRRTIPIFIPRLLELLESMPNKTGKLFSSKYTGHFLVAIKRACRRTGLPEINLHGLRHSFASLCFHLQIPEETCMLIGGWNDYYTMHKIYTHLAEADKRQHIDALREFYANANLNANSPPEKAK